MSCQSHRGRRLQTIATTAPTYPLDLSSVFYDTCASSAQSRLGSVQAGGKLDQAHIQTPVYTTNHNSAKQSPEANKGPDHVFLQDVGSPSPPVKHNRNIERCQSRRVRCLQAIVINVPSFPLDL